MKKMITIAGLLALIAAGCGPEDNPFAADPDTGLQGGAALPVILRSGTLSGGPGSSVIEDIDPGTAGIQDGLTLDFNDVMDPSTIVASSFILESTTEGSPSISIDEIVYIEETESAVIYATFESETAYMLTVLADLVTDIAGNPVDANHNGIADGSPWDDARFTFHTGSAEETDITPPVVSANTPQGGGLNDPGTEITVEFENGPMDVSLLTTANMTIVRTSDSSAVSAELIGAGDDYITIRATSDLQWGERYTIRLSSEVADESGNLLDTNGDGFIWPDEPDFIWDIQMADDESTHKTPPTVENATLAIADGWILIEFIQSLTGEDVIMDEATIIQQNIQLTDNQGNVPLSFEMSAGDEVYCFFQRPVSGSLTLWVSAMVQDEYGNYLDGNEDGLGGTPGVDDWSRVF